MPYNVLAIRDDLATDGSLYPTIGRGTWPYPVTLHPYDGAHPLHLVATIASVSQLTASKPIPLYGITDVKIDVLLTDARVILYCEKYDRGGGWIGGSTALLFNAISKAVAAARRRGKMLVGHLQYPWLAAVGACPKHRRRDEEQLRLVISDGTGSPHRLLAVDLTLQPPADALAVAQEIVRRTAAFRLRSDETFGPRQRGELEALLAAPRLQPQRKQFVLYELPTYFHVTSTGALPVGALA